MAFGNFEFPNANVYDSDLREVLRQIKELTDRYNIVVQTVEDIDTKTTEAIDEIAAVIDELQKEWDRLEIVVNQYISNALESFETKFDSKLEIYKEEVNNLIRDFDTRLKSIEIFFDTFNEKMALLKEYSDNEDKKLWLNVLNRYDPIIDEINKALEDIYAILDMLDIPNIYNPLRGRYESHEKVVRDLYEAERYGGLRNWELENYNLTNDEFNALNLCNYDIAINLRWIIEDFGVRRTVHVYNGNRTIPYNSDSFILTMMCGTLTNEKFIALDMTNEEFEALDLTNAEYLTYLSNPHGYVTPEDLIGYVHTNGNGLSNAQLDTLGVRV